MAIKAKAKFKIDDLDDLTAFEDALDVLDKKIKVDTEYTIYLLDKKKSRTLNANRYYFGVVLKTICEEVGTRDVDMVVEDLHEAMKGKFNKKVVMIEGEAYEIGETTKKFKQQDFIDYIEKVREWSLETLNCYIPLPQEVVESDFGDLYIEAYDEYK